MVKAPSGKTILINRQAERLLGLDGLGDVTSGNLSELGEVYRAGTGERYPTDETPIVRGLKGEISHADDMIVERPDGSRIQIEVFGTPITGRDGRVIASLVSFLDITDRKCAEETIRGLAQFPEEDPYPVIRLAADGALLYANTPGREWLEALEHPEGELPGVVTDLISEVLNQEGLYFEEIDNASGRVYEVTILQPEGEQYVNLYVSDITERKRAERMIRDANEKINLLTSITRHDVANQVTILKGIAQVALLNEPEPELADIFEKIDAVGSTIARQIEFTRAYQELGMRAPGWYDVAELTRVNGPETISTSCTCDAEIYGDPMLENVFFNIIDNAARHGEHATRILVHCKEEPGGLVIIIEDDGTGVPDDQKERIFEKGFGSNTGFGLFFAREILSITGITIQETGAPGRGARFELHVPKGNYRRRSGSGDISG